MPYPGGQPGRSAWVTGGSFRHMPNIVALRISSCLPHSWARPCCWASLSFLGLGVAGQAGLGLDVTWRKRAVRGARPGSLWQPGNQRRGFRLQSLRKFASGCTGSQAEKCDPNETAVRSTGACSVCLFHGQPPLAPFARGTHRLNPDTGEQAPVRMSPPVLDQFEQ